MIRPQLLLVNGERALVEILGLRLMAFEFVKRGEIVNICGDR